MIEDEGEQLTMDTHIKKISIRRLRCQMAHVRVANTTAFDQIMTGEYPHAKKDRGGRARMQELTVRRDNRDEPYACQNIAQHHCCLLRQYKDNAKAESVPFRRAIAK